MRTLAKTEKLVLGQQENETIALAHMVMLAQLVPTYAEMRFFDVTEQLLAHVQTGTYGILYEAAGPDAPIAVPVGFFTWGLLSRARAALWREGLISLNVADLKGGPQLWLVMGSKELGHGAELKQLFFEAMAAHATVFVRGDKGKFIAEKNQFYKGG